MHSIHTHTCTYIAKKHQIHTRYTTYGLMYVMYLVCILYVWPFLNVEYIHHTCTYMTHTGMCNLIYTAYRISCICMYHIVSMYLPCIYLMHLYLHVSIHVSACMTWYLLVSACMIQYEQEYLPGYTLEGRHWLSVRLPGCPWCG